jgi:hypothetical protein
MLEEWKMKKLLVIISVILLLVTAAWGVTPVYGPITALFTGSSTGISVSIANGLTAAGDTTAVTVAATDTLRLMRIDFKPDADVTGMTNIKIGSTVVYAIMNAQADNVYGKNLNTNFNIGAAGDDLVINGPAAVRYNADYRVD